MEEYTIVLGLKEIEIALCFFLSTCNDALVPISKLVQLLFWT